MTNTQRLLLDTLPHWSGVTFITASEKLGDMWLRGERSGHHSGLPYDREGIDLLRTELRRDFEGAPPVSAFQSAGALKTVADLDNEMQRFRQKPVNAAVNLRASVPRLARRDLAVHLRRVAASNRARVATRKPTATGAPRTSKPVSAGGRGER